MRGYRIAAAFLVSLCLPAAAQTQVFEGLTLYNTMMSRTMRLIDNSGQTVNSWTCASNVAYMAYLMPDSTVWRPGVYSGASMRGAAYGGLIERYDWNGDVIKSFLWSNQNHQQHHDIQPMTNGSVLVVSWERKSRAEAEAMGRQDIRGEIWPLEIVEYDPVGDSVAWEWHVWDHLIQDVDSTKPNYGVVRDHPELIDINIGRITMGGDWIHANAVDYDEAEDLIVFCSHYLNEFYIIDHSTTTEQAAGHTGGNHGKGGDILYRWGNPQNYDRGTSADQHFFVVHGVNWIRPGLRGAGNVLIFNNGDRPGSGNDYSVVEEIVPPRDSTGGFYIHPDSAFGPDTAVWSYSNPGTFYAQHLSGAFRMPNDNTFMLEGTRGRITEVTYDGQVVWQYNLGGQTGRCEKYPLDFTGVAAEHTAPPAPGQGLPTVTQEALFHTGPSGASVPGILFSVSGRRVMTLHPGRNDVSHFAPGVYFIVCSEGAARESHAIRRVTIAR